MKSYLVLFGFCLLCFACGQTKKITQDKPIAVEKKAEPYVFPYKMTEPDMESTLPKELFEISGLSYTEKDELCAIQDEEGIVFYLNKDNGSVIRKQPWYKNGDYEGIEAVGNKLYICKSNSKIYELAESAEAPIKYESFLTKAHDIEGLTYHKETNRLLLACKGKGPDEALNAKKCFIYGFDLNENKMQADPVFTLTLDEVIQYLKNRKELSEALNDFFLDKDALKFAPSAIAIHPLNNNIYMTSSKGKLLMVLNANGDILHIEKLVKKIHRQPEGLAFDPEGNLYLSNEGKKEKAEAKIYRFSMK